MSLLRGHHPPPSPAMAAAKRVAAYAAASAIKNAIDNPSQAIKTVKNLASSARNMFSRSRTQIVPRPSGGSVAAAAPMAFTSFRPPRISYKTVGNSVIVKGCEVIIPALSGSAAYGIHAVIPHNPAYWSGTRVQRIAGAYQFFHVEGLTIHYIPRVATTTAGYITIGTLSTELPQTGVEGTVLANSLGGVMGPLYYPLDSRPDLRNTPMRQYASYSPQEIDDWAFLTAISVGDATGVVGSIMFSYSIRFTQPLWDNRVFTSTNNFTSGATARITGDSALKADYGCTWYVNNATFWSAYTTSDNMAAVIFLASSTVGYVHPTVNILSVVNITVGQADSAGTGKRAIHIRYGGNDIENTHADSSNFIDVIPWMTDLSNSFGVYTEPTTQTTSFPNFPEPPLPPHSLGSCSGVVQPTAFSPRSIPRVN